MNDKKIGIALFGLGRIGQIHAVNLLRDPRVEFRWIVEELQDAARLFISQKLWNTNGHTRLITSQQAHLIWRDTETRAIIVCTPASTHREIILAALEAGKAVFCEKPLTPDLPSVIECYQKAETVGQILFCGLNRRFDPSIRALKERVGEGEIGSIRSIQANARDPAPPPADYLRNSGDFYHDSAIHDIDVACWILGEAPISVFAQGHSFHPVVKEVGDVDEATIVLKFPSGAMVNILMSRQATFGYDQRLEVLGSEGMLQTDNLRATSVSVHKKNGSTQDRVLSYFLERYKDSYQLEMTHFLDAVQGKVAALEVTAEEVIRAVYITDLCSESSKRGLVMEYKSP